MKFIKDRIHITYTAFDISNPVRKQISNMIGSEQSNSDKSGIFISLVILYSRNRRK
mgnify:CR=1 FL=1